MADRSIPFRTTAARSWTWSLSLHAELLLMLSLVGVAVLAHGINMLQYPAFTLLDDEGIYTAQAWAVLREHALAPYTYFYDHAPVGWLLLAIWTAVTGGPNAFGIAVDSGRVFMLLLHVGMVPLLFRITRKLGAGLWPAALASALFSISPLAVFYQRMVLLDNIMLFWVLLSLDLILDGSGRLSRILLSGAGFGLALLSKETAVFLIPAVLFIVVQQRWEHQGRFAIAGWLLPMLMLASWYPLYAAMKGELLPSGLAQLAASGHAGSNVSLLDSVVWQASRSGGGALNLNNNFWQLLRDDWLPRDAVLLSAGLLSTGANLVIAVVRRERRLLAAGLLGASPWLYLARGGVVLDYYILFAIPFTCLNLAVALSVPLRRVPRGLLATATPALLLLLGVGYWRVGTLAPLYTERPAAAGRAAIAWIKQELPPDSRIVMRDDMWTDLHEPSPSGPAFPDAHSHWKVAGDPAICAGVFADDWQTVDYLVVPPDMAEAFQSSQETLALQALQHAHLVKEWGADPGTLALHPRQVVQLWKVDKAGHTEAHLLQGGATSLADRFAYAGAYVDASGTVTSEAEGYALLRAVWSDDRAAFDQVWTWTHDHLLNQQGLLAWQWREGSVQDTNSAADADTDTAYALLLAGKQWQDPTLTQAGTLMVRAIWAGEVATVNGTPYMTAGPWAVQDPARLTLNPSYLFPSAYRAFHDVDPEHAWWEVLNSSYSVLDAAGREPLGGGQSAGLPPDWVGLDRGTGELVPVTLGETDTSRYGYDAARVFWRVALDAHWTGDGRADSVLRQAGFLRDEVNRLLADGLTLKSAVSAVYAHDGSVEEAAPSMVGTVGAEAALLTLDPTSASLLHARYLVGGASVQARGGVTWGDASDLYTQEWAWFGTALYANALPNIWGAASQPTD